VNAYGEANLTGAQAVDILAEAVRLGKLEPAELAASMGSVLPLASALGVEFHEVGAALAGMSKTGTDAAEASTQLRGIFNALVKPSSEAEKALAEMGLSAAGLREQLREKGLLSTLQTLTEAFDGNIEATADVFGRVTALTGVLDLMGASAEDNAEIFRLMADDIGVLDEAFALVEDTVEFKFKKAMATAQDLLLGIGLAIVDRLQPHLDTFLVWLETNGPGIAQGFSDMFEGLINFAEGPFVAEMVQGFKDMWPEIKETIVQLKELVLVLVPLLMGALENVLPMLQDMASIAADITFFIDEVVGSFEGWGGETNGIVDFIERQLNPMRKLGDALKYVRDMLNAAREAFERFKAAGGINSLDTSKINTGVIGVGRRAGGGPVSSGQSYLVGEMGPEIFTPASGGGNITPNNAMGGAVYNITINAGIGTGDGARLGEQIVSAIRRYERSSGKVFAGA
jgi:hypothetical protein